MGNFTSKAVSAPLLQPAIAGDGLKIKQLIGHFIAASSPKSKEELAAYVNKADKEGNTALHGAVFSGHLSIVKFLIEDCHASISQKNKIGCSSFWIACGYGNVHIVEYFIDQMNSMSSDLVQTCNDVNSTGDTPLLAAVSKGHLQVVENVLSALGENAWQILTNKNNSGDTLLHVAVSSGDEGPILKALLDSEDRLLSENDAISRPLGSKNAEGLSPLLVACERNFLNIVKELIKRGADVNTRDKNARTPLAIASFCGCVDVMEYLLTVTAMKKLLNEKDKNLCTPLWLASRTGNLKMVKILVDAGAELSHENNDELTAKAAAEKYLKGKVVDYFNAREIL
jgi:ankyrin repeat protein